MTNVILTVIGIILAATTALISINYGGDYYRVSIDRANAVAVTNAGSNIVAAYAVFEETHRTQPNSLDAMVTTQSFRGTLANVPGVADQGIVEHDWRDLQRSGSTQKAFVVRNLTTSTCKAINSHVNGLSLDAPIPSLPNFREGCFADDSTGTSIVYYAFL